MKYGELKTFINNVTQLLRDIFKRYQYHEIILPLLLLRRLDCVLHPTKQTVLARHAQLQIKQTSCVDSERELRQASGFTFYNTSQHDFATLAAHDSQLATRLREYVCGFSPNIREVLKNFEFDATIGKIDKAGILPLIIQRFSAIDLHPSSVDNTMMGTFFEEFIRNFNGADANVGEYFTPSDVAHLMVDLLLVKNADQTAKPQGQCEIYDCCCGCGGLLTLGKDRLAAQLPDSEIHLFGQELNPQSWAIATADLYIKDPNGCDAGNIALGSTLANDQHAGATFSHLLANPPYGLQWKSDEAAVRAEHKRGAAGRFGPGLPRINDGQLLFLLHMIKHFKEVKDGGSRLAIVLNGSALFVGDAGSGESEIRRYVLEQDLVEAIIALPEALFYNTGIGTYIWILTNCKTATRKGKVQLIDARDFHSPLQRSMGEKRKEIPPELRQDILKLLVDFIDGDKRTVTKDKKQQEVVVSRIFPTNYFGFRKITVERPLNEGDNGKQPEPLTQSLDMFGDLASAQGNHRRGPLKPDPQLRDTENVKLTESIEEYFDREVKPHVPDAWIDTKKCDAQDGKVGIVGYEINFNRVFFVYVPPRPLEEIDAELFALEMESRQLMADIFGWPAT